MRAVPRLCGFYPGIFLTTEQKARKNLSQGSHIRFFNSTCPYIMACGTMGQLQLLPDAAYIPFALRKLKLFVLELVSLNESRSKWPRGSAAVRWLRSWVRIPPGEWMSVSYECCVLSGRGLCVALITRPEESYRLWCV